MCLRSRSQLHVRRRFRFQRHGDCVYHRGYPHRSLDLFGSDACGAHYLVMRGDAQTAAVDRRYGQRPQLEVLLGSSRCGDHVHAQLGGQALGVLDKKEGVALRATFIVDPEGVIRFVSVNDMNVGRNPEEVLRVLDALQTDELCPCNWKKGDEFLKAA